MKVFNGTMGVLYILKGHLCFDHLRSYFLLSYQKSAWAFKLLNIIPDTILTFLCYFFLNISSDLNFNSSQVSQFCHLHILSTFLNLFPFINFHQIINLIPKCLNMNRMCDKQLLCYYFSAIVTPNRPVPEICHQQC